jgi:L-ascorbate metabolism protein UlaG (beta-lactamase superfamily)
MRLRLIRNATLRFEYAHRAFVTDPYLAAKHTRPSFTGRSPNPLVDLPCSPQEVLESIEMVVISHLHSDHFDPLAEQLIPKHIEILCRFEDLANLRAIGFSESKAVEDRLAWRGIEVIRAEGRHGSGKVLEDMGSVSGFVFKAASEPTVYWTGDTVWCDAVAETIASVKPDIILTHSCGAVWGDQVLIVMDAAQTVQVCRAAPGSKVVAIHMEALDHATVSRAQLRQYAEAHGIGPDRLMIPTDGETLLFRR